MRNVMAYEVHVFCFIVNDTMMDAILPLLRSVLV